MMLCMLQAMLKAEKVSAGHTAVREATFAALVTSNVLSVLYRTPNSITEGRCLMY